MSTLFSLDSSLSFSLYRKGEQLTFCIQFCPQDLYDEGNEVQLLLAKHPEGKPLAISEVF